MEAEGRSGNGGAEALGAVEEASGRGANGLVGGAPSGGRDSGSWCEDVGGALAELIFGIEVACGLHGSSWGNFDDSLGGRADGRSAALVH